MKSKIIVTYKNGDQKIVNRIEDIEKTKKVISLEFVGEFKELYLLESESYENLSSVILPEGLEIISESAFERCYKLRNINIPSSVYKISSSAFRGCSSLEKIVIPNSVYDIEECAFRSCTSLKEVILPFGIKEINSGVFSECESLESIVIPDFVVEIGANAFSNCLSLKEIILPEYLEKICEDAFYCCKGLKKISIPKKVKKIGTLCLGECERLEKLTLYNPLNSMSSFLQGCCSLTEIEFMSSFNGKIQPLFLKKVQSVSNIIFHYDDKKQLIDNLKNMLKEEREFRIDSYYFPAHVKKISFVGEQLSFIEKFRIKDLINSFYTKRKNSISCEFISKGQSLLLEDSRMEEKELISNAEEFDEEIQDLFQRIHDISNKSSESLKLHLAQVTKELIKEYEQQKLKEEPVFELELFHQLQLTSTEIGNAKLELKVKLNNILNSLMHQERLVMLLKELEQYHNLLKDTSKDFVEIPSSIEDYIIDIVKVSNELDCPSKERYIGKIKNYLEIPKREYEESLKKNLNFEIKLELVSVVDPKMKLLENLSMLYQDIVVYYKSVLPYLSLLNALEEDENRCTNYVSDDSIEGAISNINYFLFSYLEKNQLLIEERNTIFEKYIKKLDDCISNQNVSEEIYIQLVFEFRKELHPFLEKLHYQIQLHDNYQSFLTELSDSLKMLNNHTKNEEVTLISLFLNEINQLILTTNLEDDKVQLIRGEIKNFIENCIAIISTNPSKEKIVQMKQELISKLAEISLNIQIYEKKLKRFEEQYPENRRKMRK